MTAASLLGGLPRPLMAHCVATIMNRPTCVLGRRMVDHAARAGCPSAGPHPQVWAHDSSAEEGQALPSAPTMGHGWCLNGLLIMPASSMHGGSHQAQVAGATGECLHAWALHESVSAQCTPTPIRCTACQGMVCEHGARAIHKRAVRWRKHSTYTCIYGTSACSPRRSASSPSFSSNGLGARTVHKCTNAAGL